MLPLSITSNGLLYAILAATTEALGLSKTNRYQPTIADCCLGPHFAIQLLLERNPLINLPYVIDGSASTISMCIQVPMPMY